MQVASFSVSSSSESKILLPCTLGLGDTTETSQGFAADVSKTMWSSFAFLDSGCSVEALISLNFISQNKIPFVVSPTRYTVSLANGSSSGTITNQTVPLSFRIGSHVEKIVFLIADLGPDIILGLPWLRRLNPRVNWRDLQVHFSDGQTLSVSEIPESSRKIISDSAFQDSVLMPNVDFPLSQSIPVHVPTEKPTTGYENVVEQLNAPAFFRYAEKNNLTVFAVCLDILPATVEKPSSVSIHAVLNTKDYQESAIRTDQRGVPYLYRKFSGIFQQKSESPRPLPPHRPYDLAIEFVKDADGSDVTLPSSRKVYPISPAEELVLQEYLTKALERGWISHSTSPVASPCFFVKKPNGGFRLCIDYRAINNITIKNKYPIPLLVDLLPKLSRAKIFTHLDMPDAYHLVRIRKGDEWKTAFRCKFGHYQYNVVSFGLSNAPAAFQFFMNDILKDVLGTYVVVYLDDILIFSEDEESHVQHVNSVLKILQEHDLQVNPAKCSFHTTTTEFLGHIFSSKGVQMDPAKVKAVVDWPRPTTRKELQMFLGFANYYRLFIRNYSEVVTPLTRLTTNQFKTGKLPWGEEASQAFDFLKQSFISAPILKIYEQGKPVFVETDCSDFALGSILSQHDEDGNLHPVAFHSRKLLPAEINYDTHDKELLAIVDSFTTWRQYLIAADSSNPIIVLSDHERLQRFMVAQQLTRRQYRWMVKLSEFAFKIIHRPGRLSGKPDALSRRSDYAIVHGDEVHKQNFLQLFEKVEVDALHVVNQDKAWIKTVVEETSKSQLFKQFEDGKLDPEIFTSENGLLLNEGLIYLPTEKLQIDIFRRRHCAPAAGHFGVAKTVELISRDFWFPKMRTQIRRFCKNCDACMRSRPSRHKPFGLLQPLPVPEERWWDISMDFITDLPPSQGFDTLYVVKDRLSKQAHFIPTVKTATGSDIAELYLREVFRLHGASRSIVSDRDTKFTSAFWKRFMEGLNVKLNMSTAFHPQTDGSTEVINQVIEQYLRVFCNYRQDDWVTHLPLCEFAYNNSVSSTTGMTPFFANSGHHPIFDPLTFQSEVVPSAEERIDKMKIILEDLRANLTHAQACYTEQANRSRLDVPQLRVGRKVFLDMRNIKSGRPCKKLDNKKSGPYKIIQEINPVTFKLNLPSTMKIHPVFHASLLEPQTEDIIEDFKQPKPPPEIVQGEEEWVVEKICDFKKSRGKRYYLVHWLGYDESDRTWEPASNLKNAPEIVKKFHKDLKKKPAPETPRKTRRKKGGMMLETVAGS